MLKIALVKVGWNGKISESIMKSASACTQRCHVPFSCESVWILLVLEQLSNGLGSLYTRMTSPGQATSTRQARIFLVNWGTQSCSRQALTDLTRHKFQVAALSPQTVTVRMAMFSQDEQRKGHFQKHFVPSRPPPLLHSLPEIASRRTTLSVLHLFRRVISNSTGYSSSQGADLCLESLSCQFPSKWDHFSHISPFKTQWLAVACFYHQ